MKELTMSYDLKIITIDIDKYIGMIEETVKDGQLVRHLAVVKWNDYNNCLINWINAKNLGTLKNIIVSGDTIVQIEELTEEQKLELDKFVALNALAEAKAPNIMKNDAFKYFFDEQKLEQEWQQEKSPRIDGERLDPLSISNNEISNILSNINFNEKLKMLEVGRSGTLDLSKVGCIGSYSDCSSRS